MQSLQDRPPFEGYGNDDLPLAGYATLMAVFGAFFFLTHKLAGAREGNPSARYSWSDLALLALATHKISRILTKDWVTSPLRAPFTKYEENAGGGELLESSRGEGMRAALGDLLTCSYCIGPWVATGLAAGMATRPWFTRLVTTVFSLVAASDFLHEAYETLRAGRQRLSTPARG